MNERRRLEIGQERVVLHQSAHLYVLTWLPYGAALGNLDALVLDRPFCFGTEELLLSPIHRAAESRPQSAPRRVIRDRTKSAERQCASWPARLAYTPTVLTDA
jgi:hypothetical protein